jgi:chromosome segregation ATPase
VTLTNQDYDTLITELINEINAVRNKYDAFSQFTETKVADFVHTNRHLKNELAQRTQELAQRTQELAQRTQDLAITNAQRAQLHAELVSLTTRIDRLLTQRDKARSRVKFLEASRSYRIEQKLRSIVSRLLLRK